MQRRRRAIKAFILAALVTAPGLSSCDGQASPPPAAKGTWRIVSSLPEEGYTAAQSRQMENAIRLVIEETQGSIAGATIEYVSLDDSDSETGEWSPEKEKANAEQAASDPAVVAYIGPYNSGAAMVSIPITNKAGLLQISPSATWPGLTMSGYDPGEPEKYYPTGTRTFYGMMPDDSLQGYVAAKWALAGKLSRLAVLQDGSTYSAGIAAEFAHVAGTKAVTPVKIDPLNLADLPDRLGDADGLFYAPSSVSNAVAVAHALQGKAIEVFASDVALDAQFADGAGQDAARWHIVSNGVPDSALYPTTGELDTFQARFQRKYGEMPGQYAANAGDAALVVVNGIAAAVGQQPGLTPARDPILEFAQTHEQAGATGKFSFGDNNRPKGGRMSGYTWNDGSFQFDRTLEIEP